MIIQRPPQTNSLSLAFLMLRTEVPSCLLDVIHIYTFAHAVGSAKHTIPSSCPPIKILLTHQPRPHMKPSLIGAGPLFLYTLHCFFAPQASLTHRS